MQDGSTEGAVLFDSARYQASGAYRTAVDKIALEERARTEMVARMADPTLSTKTLARALGTTVVALRQAFALVGGVASALNVIRLDAALLTLVSQPPFVGIVGEVARAHGFSSSSTISSRFEARYGYSPTGVLTIRAVWPAAKFRAWLEEQADRHGFRAALDVTSIEERPGPMIWKTPRQARAKPISPPHTAP